MIEDNLIQMLEIADIKDENKHFSFHHLGIASGNMNKTIEEYQEAQYTDEDNCSDNDLGVKRHFLIHNKMPRLEVLENLPNCHPLDIYLKNFMKVFHCGYLVDNFDYCLDLLVNRLGAKKLSEVKESAYFKGKCCYILLPDKSTIEIIEDNRNK